MFGFSLLCEIKKTETSSLPNMKIHKYGIRMTDEMMKFFTEEVTFLTNEKNKSAGLLQSSCEQHDRRSTNDTDAGNHVIIRR